MKKSSRKGKKRLQKYIEDTEVRESRNVCVMEVEREKYFMDLKLPLK